MGEGGRERRTPCAVRCCPFVVPVESLASPPTRRAAGHAAARGVGSHFLRKKHGLAFADWTDFHHQRRGRGASSSQGGAPSSMDNTVRLRDWGDCRKCCDVDQRVFYHIIFL